MRTQPPLRKAQTAPGKLWIVAWVLVLLAAGAFGGALASRTLGAVIAAFVLIVALGAVAILLTVGEVRARAELRRRADQLRAADGPQSPPKRR